jgi:hypothetical protein
MTEKKEEIIIQTKLALDFIQKLYLELSYLIKEIEGLLSQEDEAFVIGRPSGYGVTTRNSTGLETINVNLWLYKKLAVFFAPKDSIELRKEQTVTDFSPDSKILYLRIVLMDKDLREPTVYIGVLKNFEKKRKAWPVKIEQVMDYIEDNENKVFGGGEIIHFDDVNISFTGRLLAIPLFDIDSSQVIYNRLIAPALKIYREKEE